MCFGKNLRYLRKLKSWSQEQLSDKLGYKSFTTIQKWESGDSEPPMNKVRSLCLLFNIPMDIILNYDLENSSQNILKKIKELKFDYNSPNDSLAEQPNIANISYNEWICGESQSYMFYLPEIADLFNVSVDYLFGKTKLFRSIDSPENIEISTMLGEKSISSAEIDHIIKYRILDKHGKEMVDFTLEKEYERSKALIKQETESNDNIVKISSHLDINAAHPRTDIDVSDNNDTSDNDIMDNDDEWK